MLGFGIWINSKPYQYPIKLNGTLFALVGSHQQKFGLSTSFTMDFTLIIYMKTHFLLNNKNA
jgi:hypothetical protein